MEVIVQVSGDEPNCFSNATSWVDNVTAAKFNEGIGNGLPGTAGAVWAVFKVFDKFFKALIKSFNKLTVVSPNNRGSVAKSSLPKNIWSAWVINFLVSILTDSWEFKLIDLAELNNKWSS